MEVYFDKQVIFFAARNAPTHKNTLISCTAHVVLQEKIGQVVPGF